MRPGRPPMNQPPVDAPPSEPLGVAAPSSDQLAQWMGALASPTRLRMLRLLQRPHYLEEVAGHVSLTRQAARKHLDQLVAVGLLERRSGVRPSGAVTEYVLLPEQLFRVLDDFEGFCAVRQGGPADYFKQTVSDGGAKARMPAAGSAAAAAARAPRSPRRPGDEAALILMRGLGHGKRVALAGGPGHAWCIGRDERCDLVLDYDPYISQRHADIQRAGPTRRDAPPPHRPAGEPGDHFTLHDLASTNGTRVNWKPVPPGQRVPLAHGDVISLGRSVLLFWNRPPQPPD